MVSTRSGAGARAGESQPTKPPLEGIKKLSSKAPKKILLPKSVFKEVVLDDDPPQDQQLPVVFGDKLPPPKKCILPRFVSEQSSGRASPASQFEDCMWTPPPPELQAPPFGGVLVPSGIVDDVLGALQRSTRPDEIIHVRSWTKYQRNSSPYDGQVMHKWLRHVLRAGMSWKIAIRQIPWHQQDAARSIMLELHADNYRYS